MGRQTRTLDNKSKGKLGLSLTVGMLLIPLSAVAAVVLTDQASEIDSEAAVTTTVANPEPATAQIVYSDVEATAEDLAYACGEGGLWLVDAEGTGTITELQQAALDALRGICESQGTPLPGKDAPPPIIETRTVLVDNSPPADTTTTTVDDRDDEEMESVDEYEDDQYEDDEYEDDQYEDDEDDEDDDEHEDDEHEDDEHEEEDDD
ncbi:MAG: hypothetical protein PVG83_01015 [Acidimicrobiia bacterium]|jgi:hypothetical protein